MSSKFWSLQFNHLCHCETKSRCWIWQTTPLALPLKGNTSLLWFNSYYSFDRLKDKHNAVFQPSVRTSVIVQGRGIAVSAVAQFHRCKISSIFQSVGSRAQREEGWLLPAAAAEWFLTELKCCMSSHGDTYNGARKRINYPPSTSGVWVSGDQTKLMGGLGVFCWCPPEG